MDCDFIIAVSTVAIAVNGVTTISKTIKASLVSSDQNARDAFVAYILNLISILSCGNNNKKQELTEVLLQNTKQERISPKLKLL